MLWLLLSSSLNEVLVFSDGMYSVMILNTRCSTIVERAFLLLSLPASNIPLTKHSFQWGHSYIWIREDISPLYPIVCRCEYVVMNFRNHMFSRLLDGCLQSTAASLNQLFTLFPLLSLTKRLLQPRAKWEHLQPTTLTTKHTLAQLSDTETHVNTHTSTTIRYRNTSKHTCSHTLSDTMLNTRLMYHS